MKTWPVLLVVMVPLAMGACDSPCTFTDPEIPSAASTEGAGGGGVGGHGEGGRAGGDAGGAGGAGGGAAALQFVVELDATMGELPEGLALTDTDAYVGYAPTGQVVKVALDDGTVTPFAQTPPIPAPNPNPNAFFLGLALSPAGDLYGALAVFNPAASPPPVGIYSVGPAGGDMTLFATEATMAFPNGLAFDAAGRLFVTDSTGKIFTVDLTTKVATPWLTDPLLAAGDAATQCAGASMLNIGANGIVVTATDAYVAVTDQGRIVRVPITAGAAGTPVVLAEDCDQLNGADGLELDADGSLLVAVNALNSVVRVDLDGTIETLVSGAPLGSPASLARDASTLYITNAAFAGDPQQPGLLRYTLP